MIQIFFHHQGMRGLIVRRSAAPRCGRVRRQQGTIHGQVTTVKGIGRGGEGPRVRGIMLVRRGRRRNRTTQIPRHKTGRWRGGR